MKNQTTLKDITVSSTDELVTLDICDTNMTFYVSELTKEELPILAAISNIRLANMLNENMEFILVLKSKVSE